MMTTKHHLNYLTLFQRMKSSRERESLRIMHKLGIITYSNMRAGYPASQSIYSIVFYLCIFQPRIFLTAAAMCAGEVPQHPPTIIAPAWCIPLSSSAKSSGLSE